MTAPLSETVRAEAQRLFDELASKRLRAKIDAALAERETLGALPGHDRDAVEGDLDSPTLIGDLAPAKVLGAKRLKRQNRGA